MLILIKANIFINMRKPVGRIRNLEPHIATRYNLYNQNILSFYLFTPIMVLSRYSITTIKIRTKNQTKVWKWEWNEFKYWKKDSRTIRQLITRLILFLSFNATAAIKERIPRNKEGNHYEPLFIFLFWWKRKGEEINASTNYFLWIIMNS